MNVLERTFGSRNRQARRGGFTLIELVMVIMILAIVAGLAVPIVGWLRRSANYGAQANTTVSLGSNLEFFRTTYGNNGYPDGLDSLLNQDGITEIDYVDSGFGRLIVPGTITGDQLACFNWLDTVYDHTIKPHESDAAGDPAVLQGNPGNTAIYPRTKAATDTEMPVAVVDLASKEGVKLLTEIYPDGVPDGVQLVVMGIGRSNEAVGRTLQNPPLDPRVDNSKVYGRYAAVFACYTPRAGRRAQLKAIVNAKGRTANDALSEFWQSTTPE